MRLLPEYRGIKVKPYMRYMSYYLFSFLFILFLIPVGGYLYISKIFFNKKGLYKA